MKMKNGVHGIVLMMFVLLVPACGWFGGPGKWLGGIMGGVTTITAEELKDRLGEPGILVINVLSKDVYDDCRIRGTLNVSLDELEKASGKWEKDQEIVVYCASYKCSASKKAYHQLSEAGFTNVRAYEGGTKEWKEKGFPIAGECKAEYLK